MKELIGANLIAKLKPAKKAYDVWDSKLTGFILRVLPSGGMVYRCEHARGKRITIGRTTVLTPAQARDEAKQILSKAVIGILPVNDKKSLKITFKNFIDNEYASWRYANRKNGEADIRRLRVNFFPICGNFSLKEITPLIIEKWRTNRINQGIQRTTVNRDIVILKAALSKAIEWELLEEHPLKTMKPFKSDSSAKVRFLDSNEEERLMHALRLRDEKIKQGRESCNHWRKERGRECLSDLRQFVFADYLFPMILVSLNTGLRRGELFNLQWKDINFDQSILTIRGTITKSEKTRPR